MASVAKYVVGTPAIGTALEEIVCDPGGQKVNLLISVRRQLFDKIFLIDGDPSTAFLGVIDLHPIVKKIFMSMRNVVKLPLADVAPRLLSASHSSLIINSPEAWYFSV